jgi:hypothetical protein
MTIGSNGRLNTGNQPKEPQDQPGFTIVMINGEKEADDNQQDFQSKK